MLMKELQGRQHVAPPIQTSALHVQQRLFPAVNDPHVYSSRLRLCISTGLCS